MNKKQYLVLAVLVAGLMVSPMAFAEEDYSQRNIFNVISDGMVTMFKSPDLKKQIINERIDLRAARRKSSMEEKNKDMGPENNYDKHMDDINNKDAREKYENDRKAAMDSWQAKSDQEKRDLNNERDEDEKRIDNERSDENRNYDKQKSDINAEYQDNDVRNAKLKDAQDNHQQKLNDLDNESKMDSAKFDSKEQDLNAALDKEKNDLNAQYDARKAELK